jgi:hypothetical protein
MHTTKQQPYSSYRNYFDTGLEVVFDGVEVVVW